MLLLKCLQALPLLSPGETLLFDSASMFRWTELQTNYSYMKPRYSSCRLWGVALCCIQMYRQSHLDQEAQRLQYGWYMWFMDPEHHEKPTRESIDPDEIKIPAIAIAITWRFHWKGVWIIDFDCGDTRSLFKSQLDELGEVRRSRPHSVMCKEDEIPYEFGIPSPFVNPLVASIVGVRIINGKIRDVRCHNPADPENDKIMEEQKYPEPPRFRSGRKRRRDDDSFSDEQEERSRAVMMYNQLQESEEARAARMLLLPERPDCLDFNLDPPRQGMIADAMITPQYVQVGRVEAHGVLDIAPTMAQQIRIEIHRPGEGGVDIVRQVNHGQRARADIDALLASQNDLIERMVACADPGYQAMNLETQITFNSGSHLK